MTSMSLLWPIVFIAGALWLAYRRVSLLTATLTYGAYLLIYTGFGDGSPVWLSVLWLTLTALVLLNVDSLRLGLISRPFLRVYRRMLPSMSVTEQEALEAGTVWWDGELFTGGPRWEKLLAATPPKLSQKERAFLDG